MTIFNNTRLTQDTLNLDLKGIRQGTYADKYFYNISLLLTQLGQDHYQFNGNSPRLDASQTDGYQPDEAVVEMQIFTRRAPFALVGGVDIALELIRYGTGYWEDGQWVDTLAAVEVEAIQDGEFVEYDGNPEHVNPVLKIRGPYRYFAALETLILGYLTRISRVATNVYEVLKAANGKNVLFFPARFDLPDVQAADGYAYYLAVQRYNVDFSADIKPFISTDAQGRWWGGSGGGTVPHGVIATFLGDTAEMMVQYARTQPLGAPRIALVDFENDCVGTSRRVTKKMFDAYITELEADNEEEASRYQLLGVRLDTSGSLIDKALEPVKNDDLNYGVNPRLVRAVREALDTAWKTWDIDEKWRNTAREFCQSVQIVVTGGFDAKKISQFEADNVPADTYGVGSSLLRNNKLTSTDFSADVVRVKVNGKWQPMAKVGRQARENNQLESIAF